MKNCLLTSRSVIGIITVFTIVRFGRIKMIEEVGIENIYAYG